MEKIDISVVICFRDWGLDRLLAAVRSHYVNAHDAGLSIEVVVSDFGSRDPVAVRDALRETGCVIARTDTDRPWNRSASLNAGISVARGEWIITTDADIVFTPQTMPALLEKAKLAPRALYLIQCRDLPESYGADRITQLLDDGTWEDGINEALTYSKIRPRWGMGGFAAFNSSTLASLNGYEERMEIWGGEDNDFAVRARRSGFPVRWLSAPSVGILHVWHEPSQTKAIETEEGKTAVDENRRILREDESQVRNLHKVIRSNSPNNDPQVCVIIPTFKRANELRDAIQSCIDQTFTDWHLLVVENGDSSEAEEVVKEFDDPRIRYLMSPRSGAAAARNFALEHTNSRYIVIHDDDDVMVSSRIADHLQALRPGVHGTYSGWIDFEDDTLSVAGKHSGKEFSFESVLCNGKVLTHGSLMLERSIYNRFRYVETLSAGIDYGFILLLARHGLKLAHTGTYGILRRLHDSNMTRVNSSEQKSAAMAMASIVKAEIDDTEYKQFRARGLAAAELECSNEENSLEELELIKERRRMRSPYLIDSQTAGRTIREAISLSNQIDDAIERAHEAKREISVVSEDLSKGASLYARLKVAAQQLRRSI